MYLDYNNIIGFLTLGLSKRGRIHFDFIYVFKFSNEFWDTYTIQYFVVKNSVYAKNI